MQQRYLIIASVVSAGAIVMLGFVILAARADAAATPIYTNGTNNGADGAVGPSGFDGSIGGAFVYNGSGDAITALGFWDYYRP